MMPCEVPRLLRQRFRGHGEDIGSQAIAGWVEAAQDPEAIAWSYGDAPRDARLWLSSWPLRHLVRGDVQAKLAKAPAQPREPSVPNAPPNPVLFARVAGAIARVAALDPLGFSMMVDSFNGQFVLAEWRAGTGASDASNLERRLVALYRFAALFFDALGAVREPECRAALMTRRFTSGDPTDASSLANLRELLGKPNLRMSEFRGLYAQGVTSTFVVLRGEQALGRVFDVEVERGLLRALGVDERAEVDLQTASLKVIAELAPHLASGGSFGADEHVALDRLALLAAGSLDAPDIAPIARHLFICRDSRCSSVLRWEVGGREAARAALAGPPSIPPPNSIPIQAGPASPHVVYCRDVLWLAFTQMAAADGKTIDELVDAAMTQYQERREAAALGSPAVPSEALGELAASPFPPSEDRTTTPPEVPALPSLVVPALEPVVDPDSIPPLGAVPVESKLLADLAPKVAPAPTSEPLEIELATAPPPLRSVAAAIESDVGEAPIAPVDRSRATHVDIVTKAPAPKPLDVEQTLPSAPRPPMTTAPLDATRPIGHPAPSPTGRTLQGLGAVEVPPIVDPSDAPRSVGRAPMGTDPLGIVVPSPTPTPVDAGDRPTPILVSADERAPEPKPPPPKGETKSLVMEVPTHHKPSDFDPLPQVIITAPPAADTAAPIDGATGAATGAAAAEDLAWSFPPMAPPKDVAHLEMKTPVRMPIASLPAIDLQEDVHERATIEPGVGEPGEGEPGGGDRRAGEPVERVGPTTVAAAATESTALPGETSEAAGRATPPLGTPLP